MVWILWEHQAEEPFRKIFNSNFQWSFNPYSIEMENIKSRWSFKGVSEPVGLPVEFLLSCMVKNNG